MQAALKFRYLDTSMNDQPPPEQSAIQDFAEARKELENDISSLIRRQWKFLGWGAVLITALLIFAVGASNFFLKSPPSLKALDTLEASNTAFRDLALALAQGAQACDTTSVGTAQSGNSSANWCDQVKELIYAHHQEQKKATEQIRDSDKKLGADALAMMQFLGGAGVLALLGYLGLMRLQNLDQELHNMRNFMFGQINSRVKELSGTVTQAVTQQTTKSLRNSLKQAEEAQKQAEEAQAYTHKAQEAFLRDTEKYKVEIQEISDKVSKEIANTIEQYPWLKDKETRDRAADFDSLRSAEQAHDLCLKLLRKGADMPAALAALEAIVEKKLPGDRADFHNIHNQAMRLDDPALGLRLAERGLELFPGDYDLMGDKASALSALGRSLEARTFMEEWRRSNPDDFARSWRPIVFYAKVVQNAPLNELTTQNLLEAFSDVTKRTPREDKAWSAYSRFLRDIGRWDEAIGTLRNGLTYNPFSQELHFVLGEMLLAIGDAETAVQELESAMRSDYQEQFQHDVSQPAIACMLAQAYEAAGQIDQAIATYQAVLGMPDSLSQIDDYAGSRLRMIGIVTGRKTDIPDDKLAALLALRMAREERSGETEED